MNANYLDGSGTEILEVGSSGGICYVYITTTREFRQLTLSPIVLMPEILDKTQSYIEMKTQVATVSAHWSADLSVLKRLGVQLQERRAT